MLFHSYLFALCFLPACLATYHLLQRFEQPKLAIWSLIGFSLLFYAWWNPAYLWILIGSVAINYGLSRILLAMKEGQSSLGVPVLALSIAANLVLLAHYKYWCLLGGEGSCHGVVLPLAISFFTFQQIEFLLDTWNGKTPSQHFASYSVFVTFFPHLIAGPITKHSEMMPQFERPNRDLWANLSIGITIFTIGLAKKAFLADPLATLADPGFASVASGNQVPMLIAWVSAVGFTLQLYFDFSAYSDMAIGISRMFGIRLPLNFNSPFKALNIVDFWQRWHLTLTRYINSHLYNPIVAFMARRSWLKMGTFPHLLTVMALPTVLVMTIAGIWHGAGAQFVVFGAMHGVMLAGYQIFRWATRKSKVVNLVQKMIPNWFSILLTFVLVVVGFVFFKSGSIDNALTILKGMAGMAWAQPPGTLEKLGPLQYYAFMIGKEDLRNIVVHLQYGYFEMLLLPLCLAVAWWMPNSQQLLGKYYSHGTTENAADNPVQYRVTPMTGRLWTLLTWKPSLTAAAFTAVVLIGALMKANFSSTAFLYFQF